MADLDALTLAQQARRLVLVTDPQLQECWEELGLRGGAAEPLLRALERKGYLSPWQSQKLLRGDTEGYYLGCYRLLYRIAAGSFGRVFRADDPQTGTVVAVKVLRRRWSDDPHSIELFEREGKVGLSLRHPNIVQILAVDCDAATQQYYIVMEFVEGGTLRDILAIRKKLEPPEALRILEDAVTGLSYAYARGLAHRDIKPTNILISSQGTAKLVDFGLAAVSAATGREDDTKIQRTIDYAGLERATGVKQGDVRSDIYFLGTVLYEMLTGRSPLAPTKDRHERQKKQRFDSIPPMNPEEVAAPASVFRLVETMMMFDPQRRHQTPAQLLEVVRVVRNDVEGKTSAPTAASPEVISSGPRTLFIIEQNQRLQDTMRDKFKELGFRVLLSPNPVRARERFEQQPFDALIVDAGTTGEQGLAVFEEIMGQAKRAGHRLGGILILSEEQTGWAEKVEPLADAAVLVRPVTLKQLYAKLCELMPGE